MMSDGTGDLDTLCETTGKLRRISVGPLGQMELDSKAIRSLPRLRARESKVQAMKIDIFKDSTGSVQRVVLWHDTNASSGERRRFHDVDPGDSHPAGGRQGPSGADANGCSFARAVGSQEAKEFALMNAEVDAVDGYYALLAVVDLFADLQSLQSPRMIPLAFLIICNGSGLSEEPLRLSRSQQR